MNNVKSIKCATMISLFLTAVSVRAQEPKGELRIYGQATQIGTVANRQFKDDNGRIVKLIYYTQRSDISGPLREESLREQSTHTYSYDEQGCRIKEQSYEPGPKLTRTYETECLDGTATPRLTTTRNASGIREAEIRYSSNGSRKTILYFDNYGKKVVSISGEIPTDIDLAHGWGEVLDGFTAGIAVNQEKGRQQELRVDASIKNVHIPEMVFR